jgi:hypothetical protein
MSNFDFEEMLRTMGMDPDTMNDNQKEVMRKAQAKTEKRDDAKDWIKEKYSGLFPNWKK